MGNNMSGLYLISPAHKRLIACLIIFMMPVTGLAIDIYTPALPSMQIFFGVSSELIKLSVTLFLAGFGLSQMVWGVLSDRYGRRAILLTGLCSCFISVLVMIFMRSFPLMLFLRLTQGISLGAVNLLTKAILLDLYQGDKLARNLKRASVAWSISPVFAPLLGGYLSSYWGWVSCFYFLSVYLLVFIILVYFFIPETHLSQSSRLKTLSFDDVLCLFKSREYVAFFLLSVISYCCLSIFYVTGSFLVQQQLGYSAVFFGYFCCFIGFAWMLGVIASRYFGKDVKREKVYSLSLVLVIISCVAIILSSSLPGLYLYAVFLFLYVLLSSYVFPTAIVGCLYQYQARAGLASAALGTGVYLGGGCVAVLASVIPLDEPTTIFFIYLILSIAFFLVSRLMLPKFISFSISHSGE